MKVVGFVSVALLFLVAGFGVAHGQSASPCVTGGAVPAGNPGLARDCETLLSIEDALRGTAALNWSASRAINSWEGVQLGGSPQRVTVLKVQRKSLDGSIPAGIGQLDKLVDFWAYHNSLQGTLPAELGNLADLRTLMLGWNSLSGEIPSTLNNLSLDRLWLRENDFTGCVPYNLSLVPDNDLSRVALPICEASGSSPTPTPTPVTPSPTATPVPEESLSEMVKRVRPAVVKITNHDGEGPSGFGSGFIVRTDSDGAAYILTNQHVVDEAKELWVLVEDETLYQADLEFTDHRRDLALLRICCGQFSTVPFMDSEILHAGDEVVLIGYAADPMLPRTFRPGRAIVPGEATVTRGIISAFRYDSMMDAQVVQHDAPQNGGNSGGPLLSRDGRVVGIATFGYHDRPDSDLFLEGLSFAVLETTAQERVRLWDLGPSAEFGPLSGSLPHDNDVYREKFESGFTATNDEFAVEATFTNPFAADVGDWDYGLYFGRTGEAGDSFMYFVVNVNDKEKNWHLYVREAGGDLHRLYAGDVPQLLTGDGDQNHVKLHVDGRWGDLFVNGQRVEWGGDYGDVSSIDLGMDRVEEHGGYVAIFTGIFQRQ